MIILICNEAFFLEKLFYVKDWRNLHDLNDSAEVVLAIILRYCWLHFMSRCITVTIKPDGLSVDRTTTWQTYSWPCSHKGNMLPVLVIDSQTLTSCAKTIHDNICYDSIIVVSLQLLCSLFILHRYRNLSFLAGRHFKSSQ
jgi:hypothetical protein